MELNTRSSTTCASISPASPCLHISNSLHSRNAFIHFVKSYRQQAAINKDKPVWRMVMEAAKKWNHMSLYEKFRYIEAANNSGYIYRSRNRRLNRVMHLMRKTLERDNKLNLIHLSTAVKQMQLWKRSELNDIWSI